MARLQRFMDHADPRTTQRYYDHLEVEYLEASLDLVPELAAISGSKRAVGSGTAPFTERPGDASAD